MLCDGEGLGERWPMLVTAQTSGCTERSCRLGRPDRVCVSNWGKIYAERCCFLVSGVPDAKVSCLSLRIT